MRKPALKILNKHSAKKKKRQKHRLVLRVETRFIYAGFAEFAQCFMLSGWTRDSKMKMANGRMLCAMRDKRAWSANAQAMALLTGELFIRLLWDIRKAVPHDLVAKRGSHLLLPSDRARVSGDEGDDGDLGLVDGSTATEVMGSSTATTGSVCRQSCPTAE